MNFTIGQRVRYRPGCGTYGYEDLVQADGCLAATVIGHTPTRVRVRLTLDYSRIGGHVQQKTACVDSASLIPEES